MAIGQKPKAIIVTDESEVDLEVGNFSQRNFLVESSLIYSRFTVRTTPEKTAIASNFSLPKINQWCVTREQKNLLNFDVIYSAGTAPYPVSIKPEMTVNFDQQLQWFLVVRAPQHLNFLDGLILRNGQFIGISFVPQNCLTRLCGT